MKRRAVLQALAAFAAGAMFDPERALWVPGRRRIFDMASGRLPSRFTVTLPDGTRWAFLGEVLPVFGGVVDPVLTKMAPDPDPVALTVPSLLPDEMVVGLRRMSDLSVSVDWSSVDDQSVGFIVRPVGGGG